MYEAAGCRRALVGAAVAVCALALAGCSASNEVSPAFDTPETTAPSGPPDDGGGYVPPRDSHERSIANELPAESAWPVEVWPYTCPEDASCAPTYLLGGVRASPSCREIEQARISDRVVGTGAAEVRVVTGVDPKLFVAIRLPDSTCGRSGVWFVLLVGGQPERWQGDDAYERWQEQLRTAICDAGELTPEQQAADRCPGAPVLTPPRTPR